ncbi:MAG: methionine--tRNA ligase [bacterium]|nr:methionine--tRNA ligase [bacterium]
MANRFYITTPIYYVNDVPHIGHAYTTVAADAAARYRRMQGDRVFFLTGTDEHGQKVEKSAAGHGIAPQQLADRVVVRFQELWKRMNISHDDFIRTTEERHHHAVHAIWNRVAEKGDIYLGEYEDWYCTPCETFLTETQMLDGRCPDCGREPERLKESSYFFRMSRYGERLLEHIEKHPEFIQPVSRRNEIVQFVRGGLKDLSVSRTTFSWGIPVPGDPDHVIYVWFDALTNYLTAIGYDSDEGKFHDFWPADFHVIGKDILRFHAVYWPTFLMSAELPLPKRVFSHGWWTVEGEKMSKSKGNVVDPYAMVDRYGPDPFRYFLLREVPFGLDGDFSEEALVGRFNSDLANDLGNLYSRVTTMLGKYCEGKVPDSSGTAEMRTRGEETVRRVDRHMGDMSFNKALQEIWGLISEANRYVDQKGPWALAKDPARADELGRVMYDLVETLRLVTLLIFPFMPETGEKAAGALNLPSDWCDAASLAWGGTPAGREIGKVAALFPRLDAKAMKKERSAAEAAAKDKPGDVEKERDGREVTLRDFARLDIRSGCVRKAEAIPKSKKLLKLLVDIGEETPRQVVAGIAENYGPDALIGRNVVVLTNLKPARFMGIESRGMVLAVEGEKGLVLLGYHDQVLPGRKIR